ncbi:MAG: hypothetical protein Q7T74_04520 [Candidatus Saccharibacteria bacterium]|nr:hypothetical protein [Candidatus Saccharibacteria bacterium]
MSSQQTNNQSSPVNKPSQGDNIFVVKPEPKKPVNKKTIWLTIILTTLGILVLIAVFFAAIVGSAGSLANDYRNLAHKQIKKLDTPIKNIEPRLVLSNRNIDSSLNTIYVSRQSQPALENTLFVGGWSSQYVKAEKLQVSVKAHYKSLDTYTVQLDKLIKFDDGVTAIMQQEPGLIAKANPDDSLSLRSVGGSYQDFASQIEKLDSPEQLTAIKKDLVQTYKNRATIYKKWALAVEAGDKSTTATNQALLIEQNNKAIVLVTDKKYIALFTPSYKKILVTQKALETALSN